MDRDEVVREARMRAALAMAKVDHDKHQPSKKKLPKGWTEGTVEDLLGPSYPRRQTPEEIEAMLTPKGSFVDKEGWFHPNECECPKCEPEETVPATPTCSYSTYPGPCCATTRLIATCGWGETWDDEDHRFMRAEGRTCSGCGGTLVPIKPSPITHGEIVAQVKAGSDDWGPREQWITEPIAEEDYPKHDSRILSKIPHDMVNSPAHYRHEDGIECVDAIRQALGAAGFISWCRGNAFKYLWRAGYKGSEQQDLEKAAWFARMASGDDPRE